MGYVGPVLGRHLAEAQPAWEVIGVDNAYYQDCLTGSDPARFFARQIIRDVRDVTPADLEGVDAVVHLAAVSNDPMGKEFENVTDEINHRSSIAIARMCRDLKIKRFVFASSCTVYGAAGEAPRNEESPMAPLTAYGRSKCDTEVGLTEFVGSGLQMTCLRFATACGMSPRLRLDLVINDFVASSLTTNKIVVLSDGTPWRPLVHVTDMARAIEWALIRDGEDLLKVNVGSNRWTWQIADLARDVASVLGNVDVSINTAAAPDKRSYRVDFSKFERLAPDHLPAADFERIILELKDGITQMHLGADDFRLSKYARLYALRELIGAGAIDRDLRRLDDQSRLRRAS
jgi:nucleoside-diphosphate-sugar epimerase